MVNHAVDFWGAYCVRKGRLTSHNFTTLDGETIPVDFFQQPTAKKSSKILLLQEILHQLIIDKLIGSLYYYLQGFIHFRWCRIPSINRITLNAYSLQVKRYCQCGVTHYRAFCCDFASQYTEVMKYFQPLKRHNLYTRANE